MALTPRAVAALREAGWSHDRRVRIPEPALARYRQLGIPVWARLWVFLSSLNGVSLAFPRADGRADQAWFDVERVLVEMDPDSISYHRGIVGDLHMVAVGRGFTDHMLFWALSDGRFIGTYDQNVWLLGTDPDGCVNNLVEVNLKQLHP